MKKTSKFSLSLALASFLASSASGQLVFEDTFNATAVNSGGFNNDIAARQANTTLPNDPYAYTAAGGAAISLNGSNVVIAGAGSFTPDTSDTLAVDLGAELVGEIYTISFELSNTSGSSGDWIGFGFGNEAVGANIADAGLLIRRNGAKSFYFADGSGTDFSTTVSGVNTWEIKIDETGANPTVQFFQNGSALNATPITISNLTGTDRTFQFNSVNSNTTATFDNLRIEVIPEPLHDAVALRGGEEAAARLRAERREASYASLLEAGVIRADGPQAAQDVFFSPISEPTKAWGEPTIYYDNGTYYMIYDYFPTPLPYGMATSQDGVYWKDHGFIFEKDEDVDDIQVMGVHRFQEDGPWVMNYSFRKKPDYPSFRMRFAVSEDGRNWKKLGPESTFLPDPRWYNTKGRWDMIDACPMGDGTHYGIWDAVPKEGSGFGSGTTRDGIRWDVLPPVRMKVPAEHQGSGGEVGGFFQFGDRYYLLYTAYNNHLSRQEFIVSSQRPEGPYEFTPRNHYRMEVPHVYTRYYRLPGGVFGSEMFWVRRDGPRYYHFPLLKKVVREDQSLWLKWWEANDKLKVHEIALSAPEETNGGGGYRRFDSPETIDFSKGTVIEGKLRLAKKTAAPRNLARDAAVTGTPGVEDINKAGGFEARNAVDGDPATHWQPDVALGETAELHLDLGAVRSIGRIRIDSRTVESVELSADGKTWHPAPPSEDYEPETFDLNGLAARFSHYYEPLDVRARYVRITNRAPSKAEAKPHVFSQIGITDIGIFEVPFLTAGREDSTLAGLVLEREGDKDYAILIGPDSTVMFGPLDKDGSPFRYGMHRNLDIHFGDEADFRLIIRGEMGEFYVNDYQVGLINFSGPNRLTGKIGFVGSGGERAISDLKAWHSDPDASLTAR
ncbi:discoidin domain-containing protein [Kiritimatiella glycovorans]|uniref:F5/8 type C domain-containing protein n=1 Tax=Kiritimatiella glycovorans TaxID=1307763 RepID=A0A0G3ELH6_9BACT|nr:discoidin domain-containing protein [Kiritimatiella glycovorans]AKJ65635.1 hypothetical protein L21SP4_02410 [Kiritimatiella glycovorans]